MLFHYRTTGSPPIELLKVPIRSNQSSVLYDDIIYIYKPYYIGFFTAFTVDGRVREP